MVKTGENVASPVPIPQGAYCRVVMIVCLLIERVGWFQKPTGAEARDVPVILTTPRPRSGGKGRT